jgi:Sodium/hydrogen exchanger family
MTRGRSPPRADSLTGRRARDVGSLHIRLLPAVVSHRFGLSALALGGRLVAGALLPGLGGRSVVSLTPLFVIVGFVLGDGVTGAVHFEARSPFVAELATVALIVILFRDGLEIDGEMLQTEWRLPRRKLVLAMPLTAAIVAVGAHVMAGLSWSESLFWERCCRRRIRCCPRESSPTRACRR